MDNTTKTKPGQTTTSKNSTSLQKAEKPLSPQKQAAQKFVVYYNQILDTGETPDPDSYHKELGDLLAPKMDELIRAFKLDGNPGIKTAFITICRSKEPVCKEVMWAAAAAPEPAQQQEEKPARKKTLVSLAELRKRPKPKWVIEGFIYENSILYLFAEPGCYKSFLAFDWAARIATGTDWLEHVKVHKRGKVVYIAAEGADGYVARADAWCVHNKIKASELEQNFYFWPESLPLTNSAEVERFIEEVAETLAGEDTPQLIVIDTLLRCSGGGNINLPDIMGTIFEGAAKIKSTLNVPNVLIVHHSGKEAGRGGLGSIVLKANCDCEYSMKKDPSTPGQVVLTAEKMKDRPELTTTLKSLKVYYTDENLEDDSSLVLIEIEAPHLKGTQLQQGEKIEIKRLPETHQALLDIIDRCEEVAYNDLRDKWVNENIKGRSLSNFNKILREKLQEHVIEKVPTTGKYRRYIAPPTEQLDQQAEAIQEPFEEEYTDYE